MFYISSLGHSATGWLSSILSEHPDLVCFHGNRSIPPRSSANYDLTPSEFVNGLIQLENNCRDKKQFGACHGYYGSLMKKDVELRGGKYLAIIRHPVKRIQSIFESKILKGLTKKNLKGLNEISTNFYDQLIDEENLRYGEQSKIFNPDIFIGTSRKKSLNSSLVNKIKRTVYRSYIAINHKLLNFKKENFELIDITGYKSKKIISLMVIDHFIRCCNSVLETDLENFNDCDHSQLLVMEKMTTSKEYFINKILSQLVNDPDKNFLPDNFQTKEVYNKHSRTSDLDHKLTYENWPQIFKYIYNSSLTKLDIKKKYISLGYKI
ncbi:MAG: hypothetical protein CMG00_00205 [Candidatus Marinimicrobia bacterium]|nr:hypothetical protein [Candidatus Neomarinimicrobiota bacterium]|tara:strand:+ start:3139 stop:4104 length:966 start_codon:yes stop_codon:yes gene_type:complete